MRTDFINILAKISKKTKLAYPIYRLCQLLPLRIDESLDAEKYMASLRPDARCSCIESHPLPKHPKYDLQIIMPVYNAEPYIAQCIESVIRQKTQYQYCLTIVNDGSTDHSLDIVQHYANYANLFILSKTNGGGGSARNMALKHIEATYVTFLDADDLLPHNAVQDWLHTAYQNHADIVEGSVQRFDKNGLFRDPLKTNEVGEHLRLSGKAASRIYRNICWKDICFPTSYWAEDNINWMLVYHLPHLKMVTIDSLVYLYRQTPNSQSLGIITHPRRIDTYWGTKACLQAAKQLQLPIDQYYLECFLRQSCLNMQRIAILGNKKLNQAIFIATRQLFNTYFHHLKTELTKEHHIEMALRSNNYKNYYLYSLFMM